MQFYRLPLAFVTAFGLTVAACGEPHSAPDTSADSSTPAAEPATHRPTETAQLPESQQSSSWYRDGQAALARAQSVVVNNERGAAKNIILFVGDGMGISTVTAMRILAGQMEGQSGEEYQLSFETMPFAGLIKTYNTNQQTPDSAGTATALMAGVKTKAGVLNVDETVARGDCVASLQHPLTTALELAENLGKSTGVVSTARITHATPAATYAKVPERGWEATAPEGCKDIAAQMVELSAGDGIDVIMGGGRRSFLPEEVEDLEGKSGKRTDGLNLIDAWKARYNDGTTEAVYIEDQSGFDQLDVVDTDKLLGLFASSHMRYEEDRKNDKAGEPSLSQMTAKAIELLSKNDKGYFAMIESGRIDHGHHAGSAYSALTDGVEMARAVQVAMDNTSAEDTLIIVTADHSHVMTIAGYPTRGNPILGKVVGNDETGEPKENVSLAADGMPYTTITYANGLGFADLGDSTNADDRYDDPVNAGRHDLHDIDTESSGFHQESLVPLDSETHGGEDVGVWARGPGAHLLTGTKEQNVIFHVMVHAGGLLD
ncbi:alkaline phosphatase [Microbulbifer agarilyticus]|uniref:Alkaline phosphatase n=1 Tax=Microbulbifer agarilyticus TaxID=260552 RepID=A0A1Q2M911_9GAMM|nr:alkaline phosphatase [Microbulbifer agarilyticus]AQQ69140.1 alkaline phosphatase [Microbulbifer agarilyticus]